MYTAIYQLPCFMPCDSLARMVGYLSCIEKVKIISESVAMTTALGFRGCERQAPVSTTDPSAAERQISAAWLHSTIGSSFIRRLIVGCFISRMPLECLSHSRRTNVHGAMMVDRVRRIVPLFRSPPPPSPLDVSSSGGIANIVLGFGNAFEVRNGCEKFRSP